MPFSKILKIFLIVNIFREGEFSCGEKECIPKALVCDGKYDCSNMEDEAWQVCETNL